MVVTGATGFVGQALCERLRNAGVPVRRAMRGGEETFREDDICIGDIAETDWARALSSIDVVVHLAARTHVMRESAADPLAEYRKVKRCGNRAARRGSSARRRAAIRLSELDQGEWRSNFRLPFTETDTPSPQDAYGIPKWEAGRALRRIARETQLRSRFSSTTAGV